MYVGPDTLINVKITGTFRVNDNSDDDYVGFVFGFRETWDQAWWGTQNMTHEYYLFDWKQNTQNYLGWIAQEGFSLNKVDGTFARTNGAVFPSFWVHTNSAQFDVLQTDFQTTNGWVSFTDYDFELYCTPTRAIIAIDGDTIFDRVDCFEPGLFGFYNYSQANARYSNFNYSLYVDYQIESENVCLGDTARFNFTDTSGCASVNAFTNIQSFYWDFGDGTISNDTNPRHVYQTADTFLVSLIATDILGCTDTNTKEVYIQAPPQADFFSEDVCFDDPMNFQDTTQMSIGSVTSWEWDFGDATGTDTLENPSYVYGSPGTYTVQMIIETNAGCRDTVEEDVTVLPNPGVDFFIDNACEGDTVFFQENVDPAGAPITNWFWDINNDGTQEYTGMTANHVFTAFGNYPVELTAINQNGCRDSTVIPALAHPLPDINFFGPGVCYREVTQFIDSTTLPYTSPAFWEWDFGDGNGITYGSVNAPWPGPTNTYDSPGTKTVNLTVTSDSGCTADFTKQIEVYFLPEADFLHDTVCNNEITTFTQNSTTQSGFLTNYSWDFGDGTTSNSISTTHDYLQPGLFETQLIVQSNLGCLDTVVKPIRIYPTPQTGFGWNNNVCEGEELVFEDQTVIQQITPGGDEIVYWQWIFNSSDTQYVQDPNFTSPDFGSVNVRLTTTSNYGCTTFTENTATIFPVPEADFSYIAACEDDSTQFENRSSIAWGLIEDYIWTFENSGTATGPNPAHPFMNSGAYDATLRVVSANGCTDSITKEVTIPETPQAAFDIDPEVDCSPMILSIDNQSTISAGDLSYEWFVNDSLVAEGGDPVIILENDTIIPIRYQIDVIAYSDDECPHRFRLPGGVTVLPAPKAGFSFADPEGNPFDQSITFENTSKYGVQWDWDFGDGNTSNAFRPTHTYDQSGTYFAKQVVINEYNCPDSLQEIIEIEPFTSLYIPKAFTPNNDGVNDRWSVKGFNEDKFFRIQIYNRWGEFMLAGDGMQFEWDGSMPNSNKTAPIGTYVYLIEYMKSDGTEETIHGTFSLLK
jgi:gliding motility-associated-like protein